MIPLGPRWKEGEKEGDSLSSSGTLGELPSSSSSSTFVVAFPPLSASEERVSSSSPVHYVATTHSRGVGDVISSTL